MTDFFDCDKFHEEKNDEFVCKTRKKGNSEL